MFCFDRLSQIRGWLPFRDFGQKKSRQGGHRSRRFLPRHGVALFFCLSEQLFLRLIGGGFLSLRTEELTQHRVCVCVFVFSP